MDRYICPIFLQTLRCMNSFEFQQKVDPVLDYQVKSKKLQTFLHRLFNSFTVTNWRLCVSQLLVLVTFPTTIRTSSTSLIESFLSLSTAIVDIYSDV